MGKVKFILFNIFIYGLCGFLVGLGASDYVFDQGRLEAINGGVIVQAEWYAIIPNIHRGGTSTTYDLGYMYVDDNGCIYKQMCVFGFIDYEKAKSYMGKKVDIYIDGKGHSIPVYEAKDFDKNGAWALMGIAIGIAVGYTTGLIIWGVVRHRRKKREVSEDTPSDMVQKRE